MNPQQYQSCLQTVSENARIQRTTENQMNYLRSCQNRVEEMSNNPESARQLQEIINIVREEIYGGFTYSI